MNIDTSHQRSSVKWSRASFRELQRTAEGEPTALLIKLRYDELIGLDALPFDVFNSEGQVIFKTGQTVSVKSLRKERERGLFRDQERLSIEEIAREELPHVSSEALEHVLDEPNTQDDANAFQLPYLVERPDAIPYLESMFYFWKQLEAGEEADIALLEVMQHQLVGDIITRMDQLQYLNQLRIRDEFTFSHTLDVTSVSIALATKVGLSTQEVEKIALSALLHDLGKLFIPKPIMFKQSRLTSSEFDVMQRHPEIGYRIILEEFRLPEDVARPALEHQELWSGGGYPQNLKGDEIHYYSQIVKIADVYDALTSKRPYKEAICSRKAIKIMLLEGSGSFNPTLLRHFIELANYPDELPEEL